MREKERERGRGIEKKREIDSEQYPVKCKTCYKVVIC